MRLNNCSVRCQVGAQALSVTATVVARTVPLVTGTICMKCTGMPDARQVQQNRQVVMITTHPNDWLGLRAVEDAAADTT